MVCVDESVIREKIKEGINSFNQGDFFEAHEILESAWRLDQTKRRILIQGLIQFSVGCYHIKQKNWSGALKVLINARKHLIPLDDSEIFVDIANVQFQVDNLIESIKQIIDLAHTHVELKVTPEILYIKE